MKYVLLVSVLVFGLVLAARPEAGPTPQQGVIRLDSRVSQLEQRLYTFENSLRTLEQQSRLSMGGVRGAAVTPEDIAALRSEIRTLQVRLMEDECGIAKLVNRLMGRNVVDTRARMLLGHRDPVPRAIVPPTVRNANDARHHLLRHLERQHDLSHARSH